MSDWIQTYTGKRFYPLNPLPEDIDVRDVAHALSLTCRFGGHCREHYNVAHHSLMVVERITNLAMAQRQVDPVVLLWALLHDASEAYLCDLPSPVKRDDRMSEYREREKAVMAAVCHKFKLPFEEPAIVRQADHEMFEIEAWSLFPPEMVMQWKYVGVDTGARVVPMSPAHAERVFLEMFALLESQR